MRLSKVMKINFILVFFFIYILIVVFTCIWINFSRSFEDLQYYTTNLMYYDWPDNILYSDKLFTYNVEKSLLLLKCCVMSSVMYSNEFNFNTFVKKENQKNKLYFRKTYKLDGLSFSRTKQNVGYVAICEDFIIISFKSTSNVNDLLVSSNVDTTDIDDGEIHKGYYNQSIEIIHTIYEILYEHNTIKKIYITGHSMGGTISSIVGYLISKNLKEYKICVYNYAALKFGNRMLKHNIEKMTNFKIFNIINKSDLVVQKPLSNKYLRIGECINFRIDTGNDNVNHGIKVYRECILKVNDVNLIKRSPFFTENLFRLVLNFVG
jgi:triacylglycerol lipase